MRRVVAISVHEPSQCPGRLTQSGPAFEVGLAQADGTVTTVLVDPCNGAVTAVRGRDGDDQDKEGDDDN